MIEKSFLIDSNILVYSCDNSDIRKHELAEELLEDCFGRGETYFISTQNLAELFSVIRNKSKNKKYLKDAKELIACILEFRYFKKINYNPQTILTAISLVEETETDFWDALIAATMLENGITCIYTENKKDFDKIPGIVAVNPFES